MYACGSPWLLSMCMRVSACGAVEWRENRKSYNHAVSHMVQVVPPIVGFINLMAGSATPISQHTRNGQHLQGKFVIGYPSSTYIITNYAGFDDTQPANSWLRTSCPHNQLPPFYEQVLKTFLLLLTATSVLLFRPFWRALNSTSSTFIFMLWSTRRSDRHCNLFHIQKMASCVVRHIRIYAL